MQERMNQHTNGYTQQQQENYIKQNQNTGKTDSGDYIDFEEIKD